MANNHNKGTNMEIYAGQNYYYIFDLSCFEYVESGTGEPMWVHYEDDKANLYSLDDMQGFAEALMIMSQENYENFCREQGKHAGTLVGSKVLDLIGRHCYMLTALDEEYYFKLESFDMDSCSFIASKIAYITPDMDKYEIEYGGVFMFTYVFAEEFRAMTGQEIKDMFDDKEGNKKSKEVADLWDTFSPTMNALKSSDATVFMKDLGTKNLGTKDESKVETIKLPKNYQPSLVNSSICPTKIAKKLKTALGKEDRPDAITVILSGVPGTGKTLAAKYIAKELGKDLKIYQLGELLGKYVGETEKALMKAFKEASEQGHFILIDEVDSLSPTREETDRNHQIQMVNSLLQALDSFNGVAFFTTNSTDRMDSAVSRRMLLEVEFKNLKKKQADAFAKEFFPKHSIINLEGGKFAPSDFAKVKDGLLFVDDKDITDKFLSSQLKKAAKSRNKEVKSHSIFNKVKTKGPIGFKVKSKEDKSNG